MSTQKDSFNPKKITAVLCAITLLVSLVVFFVSKPAAVVNLKKEPIDQLKESIAKNRESITAHQETIDTLTQRLESLAEVYTAAQTKYAEAQDAVSVASDALTAAKIELRRVCFRSFYSVKCSNTCKALHEDVANKEQLLGDAEAYAYQCELELYSVQDEPIMLNEQLSREQQAITALEGKITEIEEQIDELKADMAGDRFALFCKILGILLAVGALGLLAKFLFMEEETTKVLLISCGAIAASAFLFFIALAIHNPVWKSSAFLYLILSPYTYTILAMAMFARIIMFQATKPVVCRTVAIVALVVSAFVGAAGISVLACVPFAVAMIWFAFVIEPLVFTEYINIAKHIFLSLITFGIWILVWTYHVTKNLNKINGVDWRNARNELLLCLFLPFFYPYWFFKTGEYVEAYGQEKSKSVNLEVLALVFAFLCPLFSTVLIQNKINVVVGKPE